MLKFLGKAMAGLVLTPEAQQAISYKIAELASGPPPARAKGTAVAKTGQQAGAATRSPARSPARAELLRQAMEVYAAKQSVLAGLDDASRAKLAALARTLLGAQDGRAAPSRNSAPAASRPASRAAAARPMSPYRAELLRKAMEVRATGKEKMLSGLDDEQRAGLLCMAILSFAGG